MSLHECVEISRVKGCLLALSLMVACGAPDVEAPIPSETPIRVTGGEIRGATAEKNAEVVAFKGVPYAAPPVGDLRWRPPAAVVPWEGVRDATAPGAICVQGGGGEVTQDEDCLFLNVWAPAQASERLPVMFWIHGGGYSGGSGTRAVYDGAKLASEGAVVVTINYRLNVFGFLAHPALSAESPHGASGNYGLMDMVAALEWVGDNIAAFGGDSDRVTIFGESAGGGAVMSLMLAPQAKGLFHRAIAQSSWINGWDRALAEPARRWESAEAQGVRVAEALGLADPKDLVAMRAASAADVLAASLVDVGVPFLRDGKNVWAPNVDGWIIPDDPIVMYSSGRQHDVPLLTGMNGNEGATMTRNLDIPDAESFEAYVRAFYTDATKPQMTVASNQLVDSLIAFYEASSPESAPTKLDHLIHDMYFAGPVRLHAASQSSLSSPVWLYHFSHVPPTAFGEDYGSHHAAELVYVFGTMKNRQGGEGQDFASQRFVGDFSEVDRHLSETMRAYWLQFAASGDPNRDGLPDWPRYDAESDRHIELSGEIRAGTGLHRLGGDQWGTSAGIARLEN